MAFVPLTLPPGLYKNGTAYQSKGRWHDANLVRWCEGTLRPVGGWRKKSNSQVSGIPRAILAWRDNNANRNIAIGTPSKLYYMSETGNLTDITPTTFTVGDTNSTIKLGYGNGAYGSYAYGVRRPDNEAITPATTWSLDTWGQNLVACSSKDGKLLQWSLNIANNAAAITNAPTGCAGLVVTDQRILFALAPGGNVRKVAWSDQEDNTTWTAADTNQAGDIELQTSGAIQCAKRARGEVVIWTDMDVHVASYIGPPFVYGFQRIASGCGVIAKCAAAAIEGGAVWMSQSGFWLYDGSVRSVPCDVEDYVFSNMNTTQAAKISAFHNSDWAEVWWLYPSASSNEIDSYVAWNYRENHWTIGTLTRTCGVERGAFEFPMMMGSDRYVYEHEVGYDYDGGMVYAETGPLEIGNGERVVCARQLIPDEKMVGAVRVAFKGRFTPNGDEQTYGPYTVDDGYTDVRFTARQIAFRVEGVELGDWRVGNFRLDVVAGGER